MSYIANKNLTADFVAQSPNFLPKMWKKGAELSEENEDFFQEFEGKGKMSPVRVETDFSKDQGQKIIFRTRAGLYGDGVIGDELIGDNTEEWSVGEYELEVDYIRHAVRRNQRTEDQTAMKSEFESGMNEDLGSWLGRKKTKHLSMMFREKLHATSRLFAGAEAGVGALADIRSDHTISMDRIVAWGTQLETMGGKPAFIGRDGNNPIMRYILVAVNEALVSLKQSSDYKQAQRDGGLRGSENLIFKGGYSMVDGHIIKKYTPLDHDGAGAIGSAMNAKALLGVAITADDEVQDIKGGGNAINAAITSAKYFEFFSLFAYRFTPADILGSDVDGPSGSNPAFVGNRHVLIYNVAAGPGGSNAGKMGFYEYSANNGNKLTMAKRLRAAGEVTGNNISYTTIGGVTWDTGVWSGKHTDNHAVGSPIVETNSYGVPIGFSFMLGADGAKRGYGRFRNERTTDTYEGGFVRDTFITTVLGQSPTRRKDSRTPNCLCITHAIKYAGLPNIPDVV